MHTATRPIYLDNNATTPMDPRVFEAMRPWFMEHFGNAASTTHLFGWEAKDAVDEAREQVASLIGASSKEIIFTSGATESDNLGIKGLVGRGRNHIITCVTEHKAVIDTCKYLESTGVEVTWLSVDEQGMINLKELEQALRPETCLVAIMYANNETGLIQPVQAISEITHRQGAVFFCDATQAVGKISVDPQRDGIDVMAFTAHKIYGPKGIGALYLRRNSPASNLSAQIHGGGHERGYRSGTLNVPGIVGFGKACALASEEFMKDASRLSALRDQLEQVLLQISGAKRNGHPDCRLPNVANICFHGVEGQSMMMALSRHIAVSSGSACTSVTQEPSFVLKAMGLSDEDARSSVRFSLGRVNTGEEIQKAIEITTALVLQARNA